MRKMLVFLLLLLFAFQNCVCKADVSASLVITQGSYDSESESIAHFAAENPAIQLIYETVPDHFGWLTEQLTNRSDAVDIYRFNAETNLSKKLIESGYAIKIAVRESQTEIIKQFYPVFKDCMIEKGNLYFVPTAIHFPYLFTYNPQLFDEIGISLDAMPQNMEELLDFIDTWNDVYAYDYPDVTPFFAHGFGYSDVNDYAGILIDIYVDSQIFTVGSLDFDTELFRSLLHRVKSYNKTSTMQLAIVSRRVRNFEVLRQ